MTPFEKAVETRMRRLAGLPLRNATTFLSCCAERFLPFYERFFTIERWGDPFELKRTLDALWEVCVTGDDDLLSTHDPARVEALIPHAEDFDSVETSLAQGAADLVLSALTTAKTRSINSAALGAALETLRLGVTYRRTGFLDLGSGEEGDAFDRLLLSDPLIQREVLMEDADFADLAGEVTSLIVEDLHHRAFANRWRTESLVPDETNS